MRTRSASIKLIDTSPKRTRTKKKKKMKAAKKGKTATPRGANEAIEATKSSGEPWWHYFAQGDEQYSAYMVNEWGFEIRGDQALFEKLSLDIAQAGLSWQTILRKRKAYRRVFYNFNIDKVAKMTDQDVERILNEKDDENPFNIIIRNRSKIEAVIHNAKCIQQLRAKVADEKTPKHGVFDDLLWSMIDNKPTLNESFDKLDDAPTKTEESKKMAADLKALGFRRVGPTTCYAFMQSVGMVLDYPVHTKEWEAAKKRLEKRMEDGKKR